jgi:hypothetical protein
MKRITKTGWWTREALREGKLEIAGDPTLEGDYVVLGVPEDSQAQWGWYIVVRDVRNEQKQFMTTNLSEARRRFRYLTQSFGLTRIPPKEEPNEE